MKTTYFIQYLVTVACLVCNTSFAEPMQWISDSNGCKVANIFPQEGETIQWTGPCDQQLANGQGKLTWYLNGEVTDVYEGPLVQGWAQGLGKLSRKDGVYLGDWKNSLQHGNGRYQHQNGAWYQGQWKEGKPHGLGKMLTPEGKVFSGTWYEGVFEGEQDEDNRS
jgi:hypothetical protein